MSAAVDTLVKPFSGVLDDVFSGHDKTKDSSEVAAVPTYVPPPIPQAASSTSDPYDLDERDEMYGAQGLKVDGFTSIAEPLMNLILELFEMKERSSYLRRQAVLLILQQILGGTIERYGAILGVARVLTEVGHFRKVTENILWLVKEDMVAWYVSRFISTWWPGGELVMSWPPRSMEQREQTKKQAKSKLLAALPDAFMSMIGHENTRRGGVRLFDAFQSPLLNKHLMYTLFDEIILSIFPELQDQL